MAAEAAGTRTRRTRHVPTGAGDGRGGHAAEPTADAAASPAAAPTKLCAHAARIYGTWWGDAARHSAAINQLWHAHAACESENACKLQPRNYRRELDGDELLWTCLLTGRGRRIRYQC